MGHGALTNVQVAIIKGRLSVGQATQEDVANLVAHIEALEELMNEADGDDAFGTEGWRHRLGIDD